MGVSFLVFGCFVLFFSFPQKCNVFVEPLQCSGMSTIIIFQFLPKISSYFSCERFSVWITDSQATYGLFIVSNKQSHYCKQNAALAAIVHSSSWLW